MGGGLIISALESVYQQGLESGTFEVLCVDDCSTDNTAEVISHYAETHPEVRLIRHEKNKGCGGARNTALRQVEGEYIVLLDCDDTFEENAFKQFEEQMQPGMDLYAPLLAPQLLPCGKTYQELNCEGVYDGVRFIQKTGVPWSGPWGFIYSASLFRHCNRYFEENVMMEDGDWTINMLLNARQIQVLPFKMYNYQYNPASITRKTSTLDRCLDFVFLGVRKYQVMRQVANLPSDVSVNLESDATGPARAITTVWKYPFKQRRFFFRSLSAYLSPANVHSEDWKAYIGILPRKQQWLFKHYRVHELALVFLSPPLRATKWLYDKIKY